MPNSPKVIIAASTAAVSIVFSGILLTRCFSNYHNRGSDYITR